MSDRDPIAEQDEAARRFKERTGRESTDPAPPGFMHLTRKPDGTLEAHTYGYERDPNDEFDPFKRAGIERVHHSPSEIEQAPDAVIGHFKAGTDPRPAVAKLLSTPEAQAMIREVSADGYARQSKYPGAIEADVIEDEDGEPCVCGHGRKLHALTPHGDCWVKDCGCPFWRDPNHWSGWVPLCTCENVANWVPGTKFTRCEDCNHPSLNPDSPWYREPCLNDEALRKADGFTLEDRAPTCERCLALMSVFNDDKVDPECPRCRGTGHELDFWDDATMYVMGYPCYRCKRCGKQHLIGGGYVSSTRPTRCPCGEPFDREVVAQWR